jgi:hypothetical protein
MNILENGFRASDNDYDWLGTGIYFFQDAPLRAKQWATQQHPKNPAVIRSSIRLENCIDLLDIGWHPSLKQVYNSFVTQYKSTKRPLPTQNPDRSKAHKLDCAFFNFASELISLTGDVYIVILNHFIDFRLPSPTLGEGLGVREILDSDRITIVLEQHLWKAIAYFLILPFSISHTSKLSSKILPLSMHLF